MEDESDQKCRGCRQKPVNDVVKRGSPTKLGAFDEGLQAGEIVLAGSFTRPVACAAGDVFHADYGPPGAIGVRFV